MLKRKATILAVLACAAFTVVLLPGKAHAAGVTILPAEVDTCVQLGDCSVPTLVLDSDVMRAFAYTDNGAARYLLQYGLESGSREATNFSLESLTGSIWLGTQQVYDLDDERHFFRLYLDQVTPPPSNLWVLDSTGLDVELSLTSADLLAGGGNFVLGEGISGGFIFSGDLGTRGDIGQGGYPFGENHSFLPCLAMSCRVGATFNLVNLAVVEDGGMGVLEFDLTDDRELLYQQFQDWAFDDTWFRSQAYYVRPVPVPAAAGLFASALTVLIAGLHRRRGALLPI